MKRKALLIVGLSILLVLALGATAFAQGTTPPATPKAAQPGKALQGLKGLADRARVGVPGGFGQNWKIYDAIAAALKLTPAQLFEQLHSGKTLQEIAKAQSVEMQAVQEAMKAARGQQTQDAIQKAQDNGKITKDQADWLRKGVDNGWFGKLLKLFPRFRR